MNADSPRARALKELAAEGRLLADALIASPASADELETATVALRSLREALPKRGADDGIQVAEASLATEVVSKEFFAEQSPIFGFANIAAPPISLTVVDDHVEASANFGVVYEGPPGHLHGGWIAAVFDEVFGLVQSLTGKPGMTGRLEISYKRPTPLGVRIDFFGYIERVEGRKIYTVGHSVNADTGETLAEGKGLFISIDFDRLSSPTRPSGMGHVVPSSQLLQKLSAPTAP
jgi:acyl-coenzyme A thioesterase PaaI-like protein